MAADVGMLEDVTTANDEAVVSVTLASGRRFGPACLAVELCLSSYS